MKELIETIEKRAFPIGISLIIVTPLLLFLLSFLLPINSGSMLLIEGTIFLLVALLILKASSQWRKRK